MEAVPVALPQALQNCAPDPIGDPHLSQNIDRSSVCYRYARRARKVSFGDPSIAIHTCSHIARMVPNGTSPFNRPSPPSPPPPPLSVPPPLLLLSPPLPPPT